MSLGLILVAFISGILTVLAPCVLPLLPVIIGGSLNKDELKPPYVIIISLSLSIVIFTLLLKVGVASFGLSEQTLKTVSASLILFLGVITLFPGLWEKLSFKLGLSDSSNKFLNSASHKKGLLKDILTGVALGPVFSSCSPTYFLILATVLPESFINGVIALIIYSVGLSLSLFLVSILGQKLVKKLKWATNPEGLFKKVLGVLFILVALAIYTGVDKKIEAAILDSGFFDITKVEQKLLEKTDSDETKNTSPSDKYEVQPYIDFVEPNGYLNTDEEFLLKDYVGEKVILIDFMTYSCINCQRTFPYLNQWYEKYQDSGLLIVGIHTPEFNFEKDKNNVQQALDDFGIKFPVVQDNDKKTWRAYQNRFWPRKYLIDINGNIIYDHIGEGAYTETESEIQQALLERKEKLGLDIEIPSDLIEVKQKTRVEKSPETYIGSARGEYSHLSDFPKEGKYTNQTQPNSVELEKIYLVGDWEVTPEYIESLSDESYFIFEYKGQKAMAVLTSDQPLKLNSNSNLGSITVDKQTLYTIHQNQDGQSTINIQAPKGLRLFSLVFE